MTKNEKNTVWVFGAAVTTVFAARYAAKLKAAGQD
jgi:hypothetical protein